MWKKLFFVSDYFGKSAITEYLTTENITYGLIIFVICYYIMVKVLQQMIFRARMKQSGATLTPNWFPFIGNLVAAAKVSIREEKRGTGRSILGILPTEIMKTENGLFPPMYAYCGNFESGLLVINSCIELEKIMVSNAKKVADKSDVL